MINKVFYTELPTLVDSFLIADGNSVPLQLTAYDTP